MPTDLIEITPLTSPVNAAVTVPGSKSFTNRALLTAALADGESELTGALFSDDTRYMASSLRKLGITVEADAGASRFVVTGAGGRIPVDRAELYIGNAGTAARSLISFVALGQGTYIIDGDEPMRRSRPISDLLGALGQLGVDARSQFDNGCLPVAVHANGIAGGKARLDAGKSSQFLTSLMLVAPYTTCGLQIEMTGPFKTQYIDITMAVMDAFGVPVEHEGYHTFHIKGGQGYQPREYAIEPDASNASYFFAAAALRGGRVRVDGLSASSPQGDVHFVDVLEKMGCAVTRGESGIEVVGPRKALHGVDVDMKETSDTWPTLAAIAPFADGPVTIRNVEHTRWQESDRIEAMVTELGKLGVDITEHQDGVTISPSTIKPGSVDTYEDHRIAMSLALIGLKIPGICINDPGCVSKTFPTYFDVLGTLQT